MNLPIENLHEHNEINPLETTPMIQQPSTTSANDGKGIVFAPEIKIINEGSDYSQKHGVPVLDNNASPIMYNNTDGNISMPNDIISNNASLPSPSFPENTIDVNKITPDVVVQKQE